MIRTFKLGACAIAWVIGGATLSTAGFAATHCAKGDEVTAIQVAAVQQQLMVAALTCQETANFNAFQIGYRSELRQSDSHLMRMFKRFHGGGRGEKEYHAFKTRIANASSMRSIRDNPSYCASAKNVFAAALVPARPSLANFVSNVEIQERGSIEACELTVKLGVPRAIPNFIPKPKPSEFEGVITAQATTTN